MFGLYFSSAIIAFLRSCCLELVLKKIHCLFLGRRIIRYLPYERAAFIIDGGFIIYFFAPVSRNVHGGQYNTWNDQLPKEIGSKKPIHP